MISKPLVFWVQTLTQTKSANVKSLLAIFVKPPSIAKAFLSASFIPSWLFVAKKAAMSCGTRAIPLNAKHTSLKRSMLKKIKETDTKQNVIAIRKALGTLTFCQKFFVARPAHW